VKNMKIAALVASALVAGLVLGGIGIATATTGAKTGSAVSFGSAVSSATVGTHGGSRAIVTVLARLTGLSVDKIVAEHASGVSFATIATENGVDPSTLVDQVVAARRAQLDALVSSGSMTQAHEDALLVALRNRVQAMVDMTPGTGAGSTTTTPSVSATDTTNPCGHHAGTHRNHGPRRTDMNSQTTHHNAGSHMATSSASVRVSSNSSSNSSSNHRSGNGSRMSGSGSHRGSGGGRH
jgi:uncharacterized membrane protein YgcG